MNLKLVSTTSSGNIITQVCLNLVRFDTSQKLDGCIVQKMKDINFSAHAALILEENTVHPQRMYVRTQLLHQPKAAWYCQKIDWGKKED